jgi:WD40 repeat protein
MTQPVRVGGWLGALLLAGASLGPADGPRCRAEGPKERACLRGHTNEVPAIAITPDGKTLVSGSLDRTIKLWDLAAGKERATLRGHAGSILSLALAADGRTLASAGSDGVLKVWDLACGKERFTFRTPAFGGICVELSADGRTLASGGWDKWVRLWDLQSGRDRATFQTMMHPRVAFTPDGKTLAIGGSVLPGGQFVGTLELWDVTTGKKRPGRRTHGGGIRFLAFTADGRTLASTTLENPAVKLWEVATGKERAAFAGHMDGRTAPAFSPDGRVLAAGGVEEGTVTLWDLGTGTERATLRADANKVHAVAFTPDGRTLAVAEGPDTAIRIWDVAAVTESAPPPAPRLLDGQLESLWADLAGADAPRAYRAIWSLTAAAPQAVPWLKERVPPVAPVEPRRLARLIADLDSDLFETRESASRELEKLGEAAGPALRQGLTDRLAPEPRRRVAQLLERLEQPGSSPESLRALRAIEVLEHVANPEARRVLEQLAGGMPEARVTQEAQQSLDRLATRVRSEPDVKKAQGAEGHVLKSEGKVESIAVSPDGRWLIAGGKAETRLWALKDDGLAAHCVVLRGRAGPVSPDGRRLMTSGNDRTIRLWNLQADDPSAEGREVARYGARWEPLRGVGIGPNNRWLVTVGADSVLRLWDLKAGDESARSRVLTGRQGGYVFRSPDGRWLTTGSPAGTVGVWDLAADDPVATALVRRLKAKGYAGPQGISPDGRWLVTVAPVRRLWDLRAKDPWARSLAAFGGTDQVRSMDFSADSRRLVTGGDDGRTRLYDLTAADPGTKPIVFTGHGKDDSVREVAFSPNGRWLVTGSDDETARVWDLKAADPAARSLVLRGHTNPVSFLAVSPDGRWLVTGASYVGAFDRAARVWDLEAADPTACRAVLGGLGGPLQEVAFSPDGRWLVGRTADGTARLWDLRLARP